jgi:hypothetical protein
MSDWAEHSDELSRKSLDVFERAAHRYLVEKNMTDCEFRVVIDTLTDTISGLVPFDVLDTIYGARKELNL